MLGRVLKKKVHLCKKYQEDIFGFLSIRFPLSKQRLLNKIAASALVRDKKFKKLIFFLKRFRRRIKKWFFFLRRQLQKKKRQYRHCLFYLRRRFRRSLRIILIKYFILALKSNNKQKRLRLCGHSTRLLKISFKRLKNYSMYPTLNNTKLNILYTLGINFNKLSLFLIRLRRCKILKLKFSMRSSFGFYTLYRKRWSRFKRIFVMRQKIRRFCSRMNMRQFRLCTQKQRGLRTFGASFLLLLETRLDTILFRLNVMMTPFHGRQFLRHQGLLVNGRCVKLPSFCVSFFDIIGFRNNAFFFKYILARFKKRTIFMSLPFYYEVNFRIMVMRFIFYPTSKMLSYPCKIDPVLFGGLGDRF